MIYDLLSTFKNIVDVDKMVIDNYMPKPGLYIKISSDGKETQTLLIDKNTPKSGEKYNWFKINDYLSDIIEMNKSVDSKKQIHSSNIYTVFMKRDTLLSDGKSYKTFEENLERYYDSFKSSELPIKRKLSQATNAHNKGVNQNKEQDFFNLPEINEEDRLKNKKIILEKYNWLVDTVLSYKFESNVYVKIFFDVNLEKYQQENKRYLIPRIFNCNDYNTEIEEMIYGLSNCNMGLNSKKAYLEHKTTNYKVPFIISINDALDSKKLMELIESQKDEDGKPVLSGYIPIMDQEMFSLSNNITDEIDSHYLHIKKGIKTIIDDYDFLPGITDEIETFRLNNYLRLPDFNVETINSRKRLELTVDELLYNKNLIKNYYVDKTKVRTGFSSRHIDLLNLSKNAMHNYFYKCQDFSIRACIDKVSQELIKESLLISTYRVIEKSNIASAINLRLSLLKYFEIGGKKNMGDKVEMLSQTIKHKIIDSKPDEYQGCDNDGEFYFGAGQLTRYLISKSQADKLNYNLIDPILNAKDSNRVKSEILKLIKKYSHALNIESPRLNRLVSMIMGYEMVNESKVLFDEFIAGFASQNIIYYKKKEEEENVEE